MKIALIAFAIVLAFFQYKLWFAEGGVGETVELEKQIVKQMKINKTLDTRNKTIASEVYNLKHGHEAIASHAREDLGMIKQGEKFYQLAKEKNE